MSRPIITLTTDFGQSDSYVAQMKGVILELAPDVALVDVTHRIPAQDCAAASSVVAEIVDAFPPGTIHLVVVDPGVGTQRRAVAVENSRAGFVAPDNGVLTAALRKNAMTRGVALAERRYWRTRVSNTFHGRDVFAPVAAHWSRGVDIAQFGPALDRPLVMLPNDAPARDGDRLCGRVVRTDAFGNLITNIDESLIPQRDRPGVTIELGHTRIRGIARCYGDSPAGAVSALFDSGGLLEIAVTNGNAGEQLAAWSGDPVVVRGLSAAPESGWESEPSAHA